MTPQEKAGLAEQIINNPLFKEEWDKLERDAVERLVHADNEIARIECQCRVRAVRTFRADCEAMLRNHRERKGAPA